MTERGHPIRENIGGRMYYINDDIDPDMAASEEGRSHITSARAAQLRRQLHSETVPKIVEHDGPVVSTNTAVGWPKHIVLCILLGIFYIYCYSSCQHYPRPLPPHPSLSWQSPTAEISADYFALKELPDFDRLRGRWSDFVSKEQQLKKQSIEVASYISAILMPQLARHELSINTTDLVLAVRRSAVDQKDSACDVTAAIRQLMDETRSMDSQVQKLNDHYRETYKHSGQANVKGAERDALNEAIYGNITALQSYLESTERKILLVVTGWQTATDALDEWLQSSGDSSHPKNATKVTAVVEIVGRLGTPHERERLRNYTARMATHAGPSCYACPLCPIFDPILLCLAYLRSSIGYMSQEQALAE